MRISDWSSDVCASDLRPVRRLRLQPLFGPRWLALRRRAAVENAADLAGQGSPGKGLGEKLRAAIEPALVDDDAFRVAGNEQHLRRRARLLHRRSDLPSEIGRAHV